MRVCFWQPSVSFFDSHHLVTLDRYLQIGYVFRESDDPYPTLWAGDYYGGSIISSSTPWRQSFDTLEEAKAAVEKSALEDGFPILKKKLEVFL